MNFQNIKKKLSKHKKIYTFLSWCNIYSFSLYAGFFMGIFRIFRIKKHKIFVVNYSGKGYGDNAKYIVDELLNNYPDFEIYWGIKDKYINTLPPNVKHCKMNSITYFYHLSTAKFWINNSRFPFGIIKRKKQYYIQTWHSSLRLKKIEKDAEELLSKPLIATCKRDSKMINLIVSGCKFSTNIYKKSFWYSGDVEECGTPRCDLFFDSQKKSSLRKKVCEQYNIDTNRKILLYAPTFRKNNNEAQCYLNVEKFIENFDEQYILLVRFHPISKYTINSENKKIINVTDYGDMQELLCAADYLITDYSGCCFDMMINQKPCILFTKDLEEYLKKERNFYFTFDELPFYSTKTEDELIKLIINFNESDYLNRVKAFEEKIGLCEKGSASKYIGNLIWGMVENEKI